MRLFLIDYENVNSAGLHGIGQILPEDRVILFYSHAANTLSFEVMDEMVAAGITPERICLEHSGKNALDFQLVTFLGYLIATERADAYFIISRDSGYHAAIAFCQTYLGVKVYLKPSIKQALGSSAAKKASKQPAKPAVRQSAVPAVSPAVQPARAVRKPVRQEAEPEPVKQQNAKKPAHKAAAPQPIEAVRKLRRQQPEQSVPEQPVPEQQPEQPKKAVSNPPEAAKPAKPAKAAQKAQPDKRSGKAAAVSKRKKATVVQLQAAALPAPIPVRQESIPVDLETVMALVQPSVGVETASEILHCLLDSHSKTEFHNALQQHFDNDIVKHYYHCMKPCFVTFAE